MARCGEHKLDKFSNVVRDEIASDLIVFTAGDFSIRVILNFVYSGGPIATRKDTRK